MITRCRALKLSRSDIPFRDLKTRGLKRRMPARTFTGMAMRTGKTRTKIILWGTLRMVSRTTLAMITKIGRFSRSIRVKIWM